MYCIVFCFQSAYILYLMSDHRILIPIPPERTLPAPVLDQAGVVVLVHIGGADIFFIVFVLHVLSRINVYTLFASILNVLHKHDTKA